MGIEQVNKHLRLLQKQAKSEAAKEIGTLKKKASAIPDQVTHALSKTTEERSGDAMRPTVTSRKAKRTFVMPEVKPKMRTEKKERVKREHKGKRMTEQEILAKYPHVIKGTMEFDAEHNKMSVEAKLDCGHRARVFTSDLFQVKRCPNCRKANAAKKVAELKKISKKSK